MRQRIQYWYNHHLLDWPRKPSILELCFFWPRGVLLLTRRGQVPKWSKIGFEIASRRMRSRFVPHLEAIMDSLQAPYGLFRTSAFGFDPTTHLSQRSWRSCWETEQLQSYRGALVPSLLARVPHRIYGSHHGMTTHSTHRREGSNDYGVLK